MTFFYQIKVFLMFCVLHLTIIPTTFGNQDRDLLTAIEDIDLDKVIELLENRANPNIKHFWWNGEFVTPLIAAIRIFKEASRQNRRKILTIIDFLLEKDTDPNIQAFYSGTTALMIAIQENYPKIVKALLKAGADPSIPSRRSGKTALMIAAQKNRIHLVQQLLKNPKIEVDMQDIKDQTALMIAVQNNNLEIVKALLEAKADPDIQDRNNTTALMVAAKNNNPEIVLALLEAGADPSIPDEDGNTALMVLKQNNLINMSVFLMLKNATEKSCAKALS